MSTSRGRRTQSQALSSGHPLTPLEFKHNKNRKDQRNCFQWPRNQAIPWFISTGNQRTWVIVKSGPNNVAAFQQGKGKKQIQNGSKRVTHICGRGTCLRTSPSCSPSPLLATSSWPRFKLPTINYLTLAQKMSYTPWK